MKSLTCSEELRKHLEDQGLIDNGLNELIEIIRSHVTSNNLKSSPENKDLIMELKKLGLVLKILSLANEVDYNTILQIIALRGSLAKSMKTQDVSAESRSFIEGAYKGLEKFRDSTMIFLFVEIMDEYLSENLKLSLQNKDLILELENDKDLVEGIANFVDAVGDSRNAEEKQEETITQSIVDLLHVGASLRNHFIQFVKNQPNHVLSSLLKGLSEGLEKLIATISHEVHKPIVSISPNHH